MSSLWYRIVSSLILCSLIICNLIDTVGEALLNDGMALVLFEALITPEYDTSYKIFLYFIRVTFISPLLGFAMGFGKFWLDYFILFCFIIFHFIFIFFLIYYYYFYFYFYFYSIHLFLLISSISFLPIYLISDLFFFWFIFL